MITKKHISRVVSKLLLPVYALSIFSVSTIKTVKAIKPGEDIATSIDRCIVRKATSVENWETAIGRVVEKGSGESFSFRRELIRENIGVNPEVLDELAESLVDCMVSSKLSGRDQSFEDAIKGLSDYFTQPDNLCDPQKRFIISYLLKYLEDNKDKLGGRYRTFASAYIPELYGRLVEINEEMNRLVIKNAIGSRSVPEAKKNVLKRILTLIQVSDNTYTYRGGTLNDTYVARFGRPGSEKRSGDSFVNGEFSSKFEKSTSVLSHCGTIVIHLPFSMDFDSFRKLLGLDNPEVGYTARTSTHGATVTDSDACREVKGFMCGFKSGLASALDHISSAVGSGASMLGVDTGAVRDSYVMKNASDYMTSFNFQYGFDIPINTYNSSDDKSARGHILFSFVKSQGHSIAIIKLEDGGPGETSVTGHSHDASGASNYVSATGHIRLSDQYVKRSPLICDLSCADEIELLSKVSDIVEGAVTVPCSCEATRSPRAAVPVVCRPESLRKSERSVTALDFLTGDQRRFTDHFESVGKTSKVCIPGVQCYCCQRLCYVNYGFVIVDAGKFKDWCCEQHISDGDYGTIVSCNNKWLYASRSYSGDDIYSKLPEAFRVRLLRAQEHFVASGDKDVVKAIPNVPFNKVNIIDLPSPVAAESSDEVTE